jgi:hypothetical protein
MWRLLGARRWAVIRHVKGSAVVEVISIHWTEESAQRTALREWRRTGAIFPNPYHAKEIGDAKA